MKVAIVGLGHIANYQIEAMQHLSSVKLVGAHDIESDRAKILPSGVHFYNSLEVMLANCEADIFLVSTPNVTHYEIGKKVLLHGRHLILEKPCCQTDGELSDLLTIAEKGNSFFCVALHAAYARDLRWYLERIGSGELDYGPLIGFHIGFFDPYYNSGKLEPTAQSLGGSWFDSGINALSVLGKIIDPNMLSLVESRLTQIPSIPCSEIQGAATFDFVQDEVFGQGIIETNWTLGINRKITQLFYGSNNTQVTLHHSNETVLVHENGRLILEKNLQNGLARLTNHYIYLFQDIERRFHENDSNLQYAVQIHRLLFAAGQN